MQHAVPTLNIAIASDHAGQSYGDLLEETNEPGMLW